MTEIVDLTPAEARDYAAQYRRLLDRGDIDKTFTMRRELGRPLYADDAFLAALDTRGKTATPALIEPEVGKLIESFKASGLNAPTLDSLCVASIAISLHRIADTLAGSPDKLGVVDGVMHAVEQGIVSGGRNV